MNQLPCPAPTPDGSLLLGPGGAPLRAEGLAISPEQGPVVVGIRPEDLTLVPPDRGDLCGRVEVEERLGRETLLHVRDDGGLALRVLVPRTTRAQIGERIGLRASRDRLHLFDAESGLRLRFRSPAGPGS